MGIRTNRNITSRVQFLSFAFLMLILGLSALYVLLPGAIEEIAEPEPYSSVPDTPPSRIGKPNSPPVAIASPYVEQIEVGQRLALTGRESYDPDGEIVEYKWIVGKTGCLSGPDLTLMYSEPGLRDIMLIVVDNKGSTGSAVVSIEVRPRTFETTLILSAGPTNILALKEGAKSTIVMDLVAFNGEVSDLEVEILDDGGLDVVVEHIPESIKPSEPGELRIGVVSQKVSGEAQGATFLLRVSGNGVVSNTEHIDVMVLPKSSASDVIQQTAEMTILIACIIIAYVLLSLRRK